MIQLIETHANALTRDVLQDILTNERTRTIRMLRKEELELRICALYTNLGNWIGEPNDDVVRKEYEDWGRFRFRQGIPLSELVYCVILTKRRLRRYIRENDVFVSGGSSELLPVGLYSIQELNYRIGEFFDSALYYVARGCEAEAPGKRATA